MKHYETLSYDEFYIIFIKWRRSSAADANEFRVYANKL